MGCGVLPYYAAANREYHDQPLNTRATTRLTKEELSTSRDLFVGVALSGGGSRAANFSAAVLLELESLGLLDHATALSSVSGSSLTTAYYGLYGRDHRRWTRERLQSLLVKNSEARWIARWFLPQNIARYWLTQFDRTDIMKHVLDDVRRYLRISRIVLPAIWRVGCPSRTGLRPASSRHSSTRPCLLKSFSVSLRT
jgi:hypothetical protein